MATLAGEAPVPTARPRSAVSTGVGLCGLAGLFAWFTIARHFGMAVVEATPHLVALHEGARSVADEAMKQVISLGFLAVVLTTSPALRHWFGLAERLFLYATALWFLLATLTLPPL